MQSGRIIISVIFCTILFMQSNLKAEIIKFSSCKIIKDPIRESIFKMVNKDEPYNEKEELAKVNEEWEYIDRTFDTESKILNVKRKKKEENINTINVQEPIKLDFITNPNKYN